MANISLISTCNRSCSYCFAADTMNRPGADNSGVSLEQFEQSLDFLQQSGIPEARLLGGEPTIHPRFVEIVDRVQARGMQLLVFSGGMIPKSALDRLAEIPASDLRVLLNVAIEGVAPPAEILRQREVFRRLGDRVALGINIYSPSIKLGFLLDLIEEFGLAKVVRMGLAHPILDGDNEYLHPRYFDEVGRQVADFASAAAQRNVQLDFDCGWVPCMFPEGSLAALGITPNEVGLRCNPILDILPNGQVIPCYPLAEQFQESLSGHADAQSLADRFVERLTPIRPLGIFRKCADCDFRERGECAGGCLSLSMRRLRGSEFQFSLTKNDATDHSNVPLTTPETPAGQNALLPVVSTSSGCGCSNKQDGCVSPRTFELPDLSQLEISPLNRSSGCGGGNCCSTTPATAATSNLDRSPLAIVTRTSPTVDRTESASSTDSPAVLTTNRWSLPYIDQPLSFWNEIEQELGPRVAHVYFPLPGGTVGSGRPTLPDAFLQQFLKYSSLGKAVLLNAVTMPRPVNEVAPLVIESLRRLRGEYGLNEAVVADLLLARRIRDALPDLPLTASVLMEISEPYQARLLAGVCDTLVPASRVVRDLPALRSIRDAFPGRIRLLVNEACLPGCPFRTQHFHEMASGIPEPKSLCVEPLQEQPWLRLTGGWVLPQHLHYYKGVYDELKLAGRVTLEDPAKYLHVVRAYMNRSHLRPAEIGGGPASVLGPIEMDDELFAYTLTCGRRCHACTRCPDYYADAMARCATESSADRELVQTCW